MGGVADQADFLEAVDRVIGKVGINGLVDGIGPAVAQQDGVAVGRGAGDGIGADDAVGPGPVLDDDWLAQLAASGSDRVRAKMSAPPPGG